MPGRPCPSRNSKDAPPPVEICVMAWLQSVRASAAMVSPPPTTVVPVQAATARAISTVPWRNGGISKTPIGPFQTTVRAVQHLAKTSDSGHANIQTLPTGRNTLISHHPRRDVGLDVLGNHVITRQETLYPAFGGFGENIAGHGETVGLDQGITHRIALYLQQSIGHATTDEQGGDFLEKVHNERDFVGDWRLPKWPPGCSGGRSPCSDR